MKVLYKKYQLFVFGIFVAICTSCVEDFEFGTQNFEDILVIESTITDEDKAQEVFLSRTFRLENNEPIPEQNATITVTDDQQTTYSFVEASPGRYISSTTFAATTGRSYQLQITTADGRSYASRSATLPQTSQIDNLFAERVVNDQGVEGIGILVDSFDPTGNANFYRYEFEETYQIIPPFWSEVELEIISVNPPETNLVPRSREERVCYRTLFSNDIILTTTTTLDENRVSGFRVHFIEPDNSVLRDGYSILVKQFVQSAEANQFFNSLKEFSDSESLFSQVQPGFVRGNILSVNDPDENVLGFFDIASVSSARIFIKLKDFFPDALRPDFQVQCNVIRETDEGRTISLVQNGFRVFSFDPIAEEYFLTRPVCTDCNVLGTNVRPDFWVD